MIQQIGFLVFKPKEAKTIAHMKPTYIYLYWFDSKLPKLENNQDVLQWVKR